MSGTPMSENGEGMREEIPEGALVPVVPDPAMVQATSVAEPDDRLTVPVPETSSGGGQVPALHLHRHQHVSVTVDDEARTVIERLAERHGELFSYLHEEIRQLQEQMAQRTQFESDLAPWVEAVRGAVEAQWRDIERLQTGLQDAHDAAHTARREAATIRKDVEARLSRLEGQISALSDSTRTDLSRIRDSGYQETRLREQLRKDLTSLSQAGKISDGTLANLQ